MRNGTGGYYTPEAYRGVDSYPAFSVSELGLMLPDDGEGAWQWTTAKDAGRFEGKQIDGFSVLKEGCLTAWSEMAFPTEAQARGYILIRLLEDGETTAEDCNYRMRKQ